MPSRTITIDETLCDGCGACFDACPTGAIVLGQGKAQLDPSRCDACLACVGKCPQQAIRVTETISLPQLRPDAPPAVRSRPLTGALASAGTIALAYLAERILPRLAERALDKTLAKTTDRAPDAGDAVDKLREGRRRRRRGGRP